MSAPLRPGGIVTSESIDELDQNLTDYLNTIDQTGGVRSRFEGEVPTPAPSPPPRDPFHGPDSVVVDSVAVESTDSLSIFDSVAIESTDSLSINDMSAPANRQHVVHQDYIVRQRYSNALPPPPGAVKLMDIPTEGLSAYTTPDYASRMARAQPINIEADALLGMNIDLVGLPGIFEGDESSIQAPLVTPQPHPRDRALLRPLKSLGQPKSEVGGVSFLRRTQYTAEDSGRRHQEGGSSRKLGGATPRRRKPADVSSNDPLTLLRTTTKGFDVMNPEDTYKGPDSGENIRGAIPTAAELEAWNNPVHPVKPHLKMVDSYPFIPDLDAFTDDGSYMLVKFSGQPTDITDHYDPRMEAGLLHPLELRTEQIVHYHQKSAAHEANPERFPPPPPPAFDYEFFLPHDEITAERYREKIDIDNPSKDDPRLYTNSASGGPYNDSFRFEKVREYETGLQTDNTNSPYQEVAVTLYDSAIKQEYGAELVEPRQKGAYYYPIGSKVQLKPRRTKFLANAGLASQADDQREKIDVAILEIRESSELEKAKRGGHKAALDMDGNKLA